MQVNLHKKEDTPVIKCPRCHASNLTSQSKCGKCGYVFPHAKAKGEKKDFDPTLGSSGDSSSGEESGMAQGGGHFHSGGMAYQNPADSGGGGQQIPQGGGGESGQTPSEGGGADGEAEGKEGEEILQEPPVPKHLVDKGKSEGLISSRGEWRQCPRCGADLKPDVRRCTKCGTKIK